MSLKIRCVYNVKILEKFGIQALTLAPFILFAQSSEQISEKLFRHELQHIYQVRRLGWFKLYLTYLRFYFVSRRKGLSHFAAYWSIPYEVEAREAENKPLLPAELAMLKRPAPSSSV